MSDDNDEMSAYEFRDLLEERAESRGLDVNTHIYLEDVSDDDETDIDTLEVIQVWTFVDDQKYGFEIAYEKESTDMELGEGDVFPRRLVIDVEQHMIEHRLDQLSETILSDVVDSER